MTVVTVKKKQKPKYNFSDEVKEHFRNKDLRFAKYPSSKIGVFSSIERFTDFIQGEIDFWTKLRSTTQKDREFSNATVEKVVKEFEEIKMILNRCQNTTSSSSQYKNILKELDNKLNIFEKPSFPLVFSESEFALRVKSMKNRENDFSMIAGFFKGCIPSMTISNFSNNISNGEFFIGYNYGVRLNYPEHFNEVDSNFLEESHLIIEKLNEEHNSYINHIEDRSRALEVRFDKLETNNEANVNENNSILENLKANKDRELNDLLTEKKEELERLEETYEEKLRLSKPAEYWDRASKSFRLKGRFWAGSSVAVGIIVMIILYGILKNTTVNNAWNLESVKFTVVLTVIISIGFLLINLTIKLALSNFHLSTDATERHNLTHLYLSLLNETDNAISEKERSIVFQALFARSDSGLTKSDSGVQMPSSNQLLELHKK